jgi:hypothetical protein
MALKNFQQAALSAAPGTQALINPGPNTWMLIGMLAANKTSSTATIKVTWKDSDAGQVERVIAQDISIPPNSSINIMGSFRLALEPGDSVHTRASADNAVDISGVYDNGVK